MDCMYTALYPFFMTPQSTLHSTSHHAPIHTPFIQSTVSYAQTSLHSHRQPCRQEQHGVKYLSQGYIDCNGWDWTHNLPIEGWPQDLAATVTRTQKHFHNSYDVQVFCKTITVKYNNGLLIKVTSPCRFCPLWLYRDFSFNKQQIQT